MNRFLSIAVLLLIAVSASAADSNRRNPEQVTVATTGRIAKIDFENRILKVRGSDGQSIRNLPDMKQNLKPKIGVTLPGGFTIALPSIITGKNPASRPASSPSNEKNNLDEFTVVVTRDTVIEDGGDAIRLEDFKTGETISIHGSLSGTTLTASRIAKWS